LGTQTTRTDLRLAGPIPWRLPRRVRGPTAGGSDPAVRPDRWAFARGRPTDRASRASVRL